MAKGIFLIFLMAIPLIAQGANILAFFPFPAKSHQNLFHPIVARLADKGHKVKFVSPLPIKNPHPNLQQISVANSLAKVHNSLNLFSFGDLYAPSVVAELGNMGLDLGDIIYSSPEIQKLIHSNEHYDLVMMESLFWQDPIAAFMHKFKAPGVDIAPFGDHAWANELAGLPDNPSYMVDFKSLFTDDMTFWEKLHNSYISYSTLLVHYYYQRLFQQQMDKHFNYTGWESRPPIGRLMSDKALILSDSHHSTSYPSPKAPHMKDIGGVHIGSPKPLPKDIQTFMDGAKDGVIYFSMGSNLNMTEFSTKHMDDLLKVFGKLKQRVLWKWGTDTVPKLSPNIKMSSWFPQQDILAHKNTKAFISHGGYLSVSEAVHYGVPIVGIPFFGDQPKNMRQVEHRGYGIKIERDNISAASIGWAVNEILTNPRYQETMTRTSALFKERQMQPLDEAIYWIEYVIKHGNVLQPRAAHLSFCAMHMLDIYGTILLAVYIIYKMLRCLLCLVCNRKSRKQQSKSKKD